MRNQMHDNESSATHVWHHVTDIDLPIVTKPLEQHIEENAHLQKIATGNIQYAVKRCEQGGAIDTTCPTCGHPIEDKDHMYWGCRSGDRTRADRKFAPLLEMPQREIPALLRWHAVAPALRATLYGQWWEMQTNHNFLEAQQQELFGGVYDADTRQQIHQFLREVQAPCDDNGSTENRVEQVVLGVHGPTTHDIGDLPAFSLEGTRTGTASAPHYL